MNNYTATNLLSTLEYTNDAPIERMVELFGIHLMHRVHNMGLIEYLPGARGTVVNLSDDVDPSNLTEEQAKALATVESID